MSHDVADDDDSLDLEAWLRLISDPLTLQEKRESAATAVWQALLPRILWLVDKRLATVVLENASAEILEKIHREIFSPEALGKIASTYDGSKGSCKHYVMRQVQWTLQMEIRRLQPHLQPLTDQPGTSDYAADQSDSPSSEQLPAEWQENLATLPEFQRVVWSLRMIFEIEPTESVWEEIVELSNHPKERWLEALAAIKQQKVEVREDQSVRLAMGLRLAKLRFAQERARHLEKDLRSKSVTPADLDLLQKSVEKTTQKQAPTVWRNVLTHWSFTRRQELETVLREYCICRQAEWKLSQQLANVQAEVKSQQQFTPLEHAWIAERLQSTVANVQAAFSRANRKLREDFLSG